LDIITDALIANCPVAAVMFAPVRVVLVAEAVTPATVDEVSPRIR